MPLNSFNYKGLLLLNLAILTGCGNEDARWEAECAASRDLYQKVVAAMCTPWSEQRGAALGELIDASQDRRFDGEITADTILDYVGGIGSDDCVKAGFADPGEKLVDPDRERIRERMKKIPPPHPPSAAEMEKLRSDMANAKRCNLEAS